MWCMQHDAWHDKHGDCMWTRIFHWGNNKPSNQMSRKEIKIHYQVTIDRVSSEATRSQYMFPHALGRGLLVPITTSRQGHASWGGCASHNEGAVLRWGWKNTINSQSNWRAGHRHPFKDSDTQVVAKRTSLRTAAWISERLLWGAGDVISRAEMSGRKLLLCNRGSDTYLHCFCICHQYSRTV